MTPEEIEQAAREIVCKGYCPENYHPTKHIQHCDQATASIVKLVQRGQREELDYLDHEPKMHGDWQEVIAARLAALTPTETKQEGEEYA